MSWIENCNRRDLLNKDLSKLWKSTHVCGKHFENRMFLNNLKNRLQPHAIPTLFLGISSKEEQSIQEDNSVQCKFIFWFNLLIKLRISSTPCYLYLV